MRPQVHSPPTLVMWRALVQSRLVHSLAAAEAAPVDRLVALMHSLAEGLLRKLSARSSDLLPTRHWSRPHDSQRTAAVRLQLSCNPRGCISCPLTRPAQQADDGRRILMMRVQHYRTSTNRGRGASHVTREELGLKQTLRRKQSLNAGTRQPVCEHGKVELSRARRRLTAAELAPSDAVTGPP